MIRCFLFLSVLGGSLLIADVVLGFLAATGVSGPNADGRAIHRVLSLLTVALILGIHSMVSIYFAATGKRAGELVRVHRLRDRFLAQAERNRRRAFRFVVGSVMAIVIAAGLGFLADRAGESDATWHLIAAMMALAFNLGSFLVEYVSIVGQARLLAEWKEAVGRRRTGRYDHSPDSGQVLLAGGQ